MGYPSSEPAWQQTELNNLSAAGKLSGLSPLVLSGIAENESGYENKGAGINSSGYGGYFGLGQNSSYSFGGQSFTETPSLLESNSQPAFDQQAEAAAAALASYIQETGSLQAGLAKYTGGGPTNGDYEDAVSILGGTSPSLSGQSFPVTGGGGAAPAGGLSTAATNATTASLGGSLNPTNWAQDAITTFKPYLGRAIMILVALILLKVGVDKLLDTDSTPLDIAAQSPQSLGGGGGGASKGMSGPGAGATPPPAPPPSAPPQEEQPPARHKEHPAAKDAEHAAEVAPAALA